MAVVATFAESFIEDIFKGVHNLPSNTLKCALLKTTYSFDAEADSDWADISDDQISTAGGYAAGGITLTGVAVAASDGIVNITCTNNPTWTASAAAIDTTRAAAIINTTPATPKIIMVIDFGADYATPDGRMFQVNLSNGLAKATITL